MDVALAQRMRLVTESILEDERLTTELEDTAANVLLKWGIECARMIARSTDGLDDATAEALMYPRLRATPRLMRTVNKWVAGAKHGKLDAQSSGKLLQMIIKVAGIIYEEDFKPPNKLQFHAFLKTHLDFADNPEQKIKDLRLFILESTHTSTSV